MKNELLGRTGRGLVEYTDWIKTIPCILLKILSSFVVLAPLNGTTSPDLSMQDKKKRSFKTVLASPESNV